MAAMKIDPTKRAAVNLRYSQKLVDLFKRLGATVAGFNRTQEPKEVKETEAGTLGWAVMRATEDSGIIPDVIYDLGEIGKEPMIRLIGTSATELVDRIIRAKKVILKEKRRVLEAP